jgi:hypothetical protein
MQVGANANNVVFVPVGIQGTETGDFISAPIPTKTNRWVNVCAFIDLTNDRQEVYYDGTLIARVRWRPNITQSLLQIHTINVYGGDLGGTSWVDDLAVVPDCPKTYQVGFKDAWFWGGDYTPVSPQLLPWLPATPIQFDQFPFDQAFGASFMNLPSGPCMNFKGAFFSPMRANPTAGALANTDQLRLGLKPSSTWAYTAGLGALTGTTWGSAGLRNVNVDLDANVLMEINDTGRLDFMTSWFTGADYARLKLWNCNPCWRGYWWDVIGPIELDFTTAGLLRPNFGNGDGWVICELDNSAGGELQFGLSPTLTSLATHLSLTAIGRVNGQEGQQVAKLDIQGGPSQAKVTGDFSTISTTNIRVRLYNQAGTLLHDTPRMPQNLLSFTSPEDLRITAWSERSRPDKEEFTITVQPTSVLVGGTNVANVARIEVVALNPGAARGNITQLRLGGQGNPAVELSGVRGYLSGGMAISAKSGATVSMFPDGIVLERPPAPAFITLLNTGVTDDTYWRVSMPPASGFRVPFVLDEPEAGDGVTFCGFATLNGIAYRPVGRIYLVQTANGCQAVADYSSVSSPTVNVRVFRQGQLVTNQAGMPADSVTLSQMPIVCEKGGIGPPCFALTLPSIQPITVGGNQYLGDMVAILAEPTLPIEVGSYTDWWIDIVTRRSKSCSIKPMVLRSVSGTVTLGEFEPDEAGQMVSLEYRYPGSEEVLDVEYVTLGAGGTFTTTTGLYGTVEVLVKGSHWLRKLTTIQVGDSGATGLAVTLVNGDCDGDNEVSIGDFAMISSSFNKCEGDPGFQSNADLNGDGCVDIGDFAIMSGNFGEIGD